MRDAILEGRPRYCLPKEQLLEISNGSEVLIESRSVDDEVASLVDDEQVEEKTQ